MARIDFYHLQRQTLEEVLPKLVTKAYATGKRVLICTKSEEKADQLNDWLWVFNDESFIPHGTKKDGFTDQQPVFITSDNQNANNAEFLFVVNSAEISVEKMTDYERAFFIFDGNSSTELDQARNFWKQAKISACETHYWQQNNQGLWEQKA